jgi:hypothetical protein
VLETNQSRSARRAIATSASSWLSLLLLDPTTCGYSSALKSRGDVVIVGDFFFLKNLVAKQSASVASDSPHSRLLEKQAFYGSVLGKSYPKQGLNGKVRKHIPHIIQPLQR